MYLFDRKPSELMPAEIEMLKEAGSALARCGEKLEKALGQLQEAERTLDHCLVHNEDPWPLPFSEAVEKYRRARKKAEQAHYSYLVHREALGLRNHRFVARIYPLPPVRNCRPTQRSRGR